MALIPTLRALLADGQWHSLDDLAIAVGHEIRPEIAMRCYLRHFAYSQSNEALLLDWAILMGRRGVIRTALWQLGTERRGAVGMAEYRLLPPADGLRQRGRRC